MKWDHQPIFGLPQGLDLSIWFHPPQGMTIPGWPWYYFRNPLETWHNSINHRTTTAQSIWARHGHHRRSLRCWEDVLAAGHQERARDEEGSIQTPILVTKWRPKFWGKTMENPKATDFVDHIEEIWRIYSVYLWYLHIIYTLTIQSRGSKNFPRKKSFAGILVRRIITLEFRYLVSSIKWMHHEHQSCIIQETSRNYPNQVSFWSGCWNLQIQQLLFRSNISRPQILGHGWQAVAYLTPFMEEERRAQASWLFKSCWVRFKHVQTIRSVR